MKNIPCFILARKGSKRLKNKNIINFRGKPLVQHTIDYAKKSKYISDIVISTDDPKVKKISDKSKCFTIYPRPKKISNDKSTSFQALKHAIKIFKRKKNFKIFAYLQVTEPLRPKKILDKCIQNLLKNKNINSSFAAFETNKTFIIENNNNYYSFNPKYNPEKNLKKKTIYREDCGLSLASKVTCVEKHNRLYLKPYKLVKYKSLHSIIDIHNRHDLKLAEKAFNLINTSRN